MTDPLEPLSPEVTVDNVLQGLAMDVADLTDFARATATLPYLRSNAGLLMACRDNLDRLINELVPVRIAAE